MIAIIDCGSDKVCDISKIVSDLWYENEVFLMQDLLQKKWLCKWDFERFDGIIISGSPVTLTQKNRDAYLKLFPFIGEIGTPILWICFGHQLIGHTMGASYSIWEFIKWKNKIHFFQRQNRLFHGIKSKIFMENHEEHITLPPDFILLAYSDNCKNEAMKHSSKNIYSVQFHPEISGESGERLLHNFLKICKK